MVIAKMKNYDEYTMSYKQNHAVVYDTWNITSNSERKSYSEKFSASASNN